MYPIAPSAQVVNRGLDVETETLFLRGTAGSVLSVRMALFNHLGDPERTFC